ncbi:MAG: hypothetical protein KYX64_00295 [Sphingopyxis sp.]|nr:hypothetical protein [Sphingopyxis sp.]
MTIRPILSRGIVPGTEPKLPLMPTEFLAAEDYIMNLVGTVGEAQVAHVGI